MEVNQQEHQESYSELFRVLDKATLESKETLDQVVVLIGMSRVGKSTILRWMTNPNSLIGSRMAANRIYIDVKDQQKLAEIGHTMVSVTILPNKAILYIGNKRIMVVDFGGFGERKGAHDAIKVNYAITSYLLNMKKVKFLIVISEKGFTDISSHAYRDSFSEFLNLFDFNSMEEQDQRQLFNSVSICVTAARDSDETILIDQLIQNSEGLKALYDTNPGYMEKYPIYQRLMKNLISSKRILTFPEAQPNRPPPPCMILQQLERKGCQYFSLEGRKRRNMLWYPFAEQYSKLQPNEKEKCKNSILKRFQLVKILDDVFKEVLLALTDNLSKKKIDLAEFVNKLRQFIQLHNFYGEMPLDIDNEPIQDLSVVRRLDLLRRMHQINSEIVLYSDWELNQRSELPGEDLSDMLVRYHSSFLLGKFNEQMDIFKLILGRTPEIKQILKRISQIIKKTMNQIIIFQSLNTKNQTGRIQQIANVLRLIRQNLSFGNLFITDIPSLEIRFVEDLSSKLNQISCDYPEEYQQIVDEVLRLQNIHHQLDSISIYRIVQRCYSLQTELFLPRRLDLSLESLSKGLFFSVKHQLCLEVLPKVNDDERGKLLTPQQDMLKSIIAVLIISKNQSFALSLCDDLKQPSLKSSAYKSILKREVNKDYLRQYAEHCRLTGQSEKSIDLYRQYMKLTNKDCRNIIRDIENDFARNSQIREEIIQKEKNSFMPTDKLLILIEQLYRTILRLPNPLRINCEEQRLRYRVRIGDLLREQAVTRELPTNPTNMEYLTFATALLPIIENKMITVLLSAGPGRGMTTSAYAIAGKNLQYKEIAGRICYDRLDDAKDNRINHYGGKPTSIPCIVSASETEVVIDSGSFFDQQPDRVIFAASVLEKLMKSSGGFRFMFLVREHDLIDSQCQEIVLLISFLIKIFEINTVDNPLLRQVGSSLSLLISFSQQQNEAVRKIKRLKEQLRDRQFLIENERRYHLPLKALEVCHDLLDCVRRRTFYLKTPESSSGRFQTNKFLNPAGLNETLELDEDRWRYLPTDRLAPAFSKLVADNMLESEVNILKEIICDKQEKQVRFQIKQIFSFVLEKYRDFKERLQAQDISLLLDDMRIVLQLQLPENEEPMPLLGDCTKKLKIIRQLFGIKKIFKRVDAFQFFFPEDYAKFFDMVLQVVTTLFDNSTLLCPFNSREVQIMKSWKTHLCERLTELREMSIILGESKFSMEINQIRNIWDDITGQTYWLDDLSETFMELCNLPEVNNIQFLEEREECLDCYRVILEDIRKEQNNIQVISELIQVAYAQVDLYKTLERTQPLIETQLFIARTLMENINPERTEIEEQPRALLSEIACLIAKQKPELALKIGKFIGCEFALEAAYKQLQKREQTRDTKVKYLVILIDLGIRLRMRPLELKVLHERLMSLIPSNIPLFQLFKTIENVPIYRQQHYPEKNTKVQGDVIYSFLDTLEVEIRQ